MDSLPTGPEYYPTSPSSAQARISRLKRDLVASIYLQDGPLWEVVRDIRGHWNVTPRKTVPSSDDISTYYPVEQAPTGKWTLKRLKFNDRWQGDLKLLQARFVPEPLRMGPAWNEFFGACIMCDPPEDRLSEFAEFGRIYPFPFWPVVDCEDDEIDRSKVLSMIAPPVERVLKEAYEDDGVFMEYRIIVDEHTKEADVVHAFRAIKAACDMRNRGGRPAIDKLAAIQCAILYDDYNGTDPEDGRGRIWTYKKLANKFRQLGVKNERSAEEHVKRGRELRKKFRNP